MVTKCNPLHNRKCNKKYVFSCIQVSLLVVSFFPRGNCAKFIRWYRATVNSMLSVPAKKMERKWSCIYQEISWIETLQCPPSRPLSWAIISSQSAMSCSIFGRRNRPFPSSLVPLFRNESKCETFHMKMSSACSSIFMQIKVIFIRMVSHLDSLWNRGTRELGNGLLEPIHKN